MELSLIRNLHDKDFYDANRGSRCPITLFSKDVQKIKATIDDAVTKYDRSVTPEEVEALFFINNPTLTTSQKNQYKSLFHTIQNVNPMGDDIAQEVLSKLFQQIIGEEVANIGFDYVNGQGNSLEPLRKILEQYQDDFTPALKVDWDDIDLETLINKADLEARWTFNIPTLMRKVEGVNDGHLIEVGARPNTGKTSFHASIVAGPGGFAEQGAKCVVLCNEEAYHRVGARYLTAATGMNMGEIKANPAKASALYQPIKDNVRIKDSSGRDMNWVESVCKAYKPDVLILDMGDKFKDKRKTFARDDQALAENAAHARVIAKQYSCAVFYMSQLSAEAEGKIVLNQSMMEGSRTGKAAEADLMVLIAKNPAVEGQEESDPQRHLNVVKNKLSGWHGNVHCTLQHTTARYEA